MNLIICCTPLQVLIAEKIIEMHPNDEFFGVMLSTVKNTKFDFYQSRLEKKCSQFFAMQQHSERLQLLKEIVYLKWTFIGKNFDKVFVANINELEIQFILSTIRFNQLNTFDDGTANIVLQSLFYKEDNVGLNRKLINTLLGNKYSLDKLKALSVAHYTIYRDFPNIISNTIYVDLIEARDIKNVSQENDKIINILLGQPIFEREDEKNIALAEKVINTFDIDLYLPHPRETYRLSNVEYINTNLILEDYIFQEFSQKKCRVYTYFSSAVINILNKSPNIEVVALRVDTDNPAYLASYDLLEKLGIQIIDIRE
ncbi:CMP-N-acetylneuraminate-beta-galactosamide-alpha-2, 3-sialyltransferase [Mannheimia granulomatis]|uniref:CMP-N-acetylneuraminate-beta-galactosamide-alpha-2, 3-sialyltransferase n=1 Tax=Mannheimia granulomatis TaxID=85402 RepID=A0A6G8JG07_9PAST|nr:glycosyltransferase family 52 [Mannheimia granulomatis]QIM66105.1 CMP-N-acetylneuraminate-beta-galactosamide-alpha-2, 3-sialyltransferase [Mannheimia granulomatis]